MMASANKVNIFCPIETINRELDFRLFFAALAARPDLRFVVGHRYTIYDLAMEIGGGVYIGQSMRPVAPSTHKLSLIKRLEALRMRGTTLCVVDEEGGVMTGDEARWKQWLDFRIDAPSLQPQEHLCTWGDWQRDYYRGLDVPDASQIHTTGHPRFDLYKPQFRRYYDQETDKWKARYGDFVLINTNFAISNNVGGIEVDFPKGWHQKHDANTKIDAVRRWSHVGQVRSKMVALVMRLSIELPHLNFVIRPHPSENMHSYRVIFNDAANVFVEHEGSVGGWLLASRALIHDGCTTALEAHFCDVPILNYKGVVDERYDLKLPNALGERCESEERVLECLHHILKNDQNIGKTVAVPEIAEQLIYNFTGDSFAALTNVLHDIADGEKPSAPCEAVLQRHRRRDFLHPFVRRLKRNRRSHDHTKIEKFYGFETTDLPRRFETMREVTGKDVRLDMISSRAFTIEC